MRAERPKERDESEREGKNEVEARSIDSHQLEHRQGKAQ
jgi:hypothetical protein